MDRDGVFDFEPSGSDEPSGSEELASSYDEPTDSGSESSSTTNNRLPRSYKNFRRNGKWLHRCSRCGYESDHKANVGRHFKRIHSPLLKPKVCFCGQKFITKGDFYHHFQSLHPCCRHSTFFVQEKYKIGKLNHNKPDDKKIADKENNSNVNIMAANAKFDSISRAYLADIDFDELNAVLNLKYLKCLG